MLRGVIILLVILSSMLIVDVPMSSTSTMKNSLVDRHRIFNSDNFITESSISTKSSGSSEASIQIGRTRVLEGVRIFVDAGHGGTDSGAVNSNLGVLEKDVNLAIALKLGSLLQNYGADVVYSRTTDVYVTLEQRVLWANNNDSDIFISIHCNAVDDPTVRGFEVYYHGAENTTNNDYNGYDLARVIHDAVVREVSWSGYSIVDRGVRADTSVYTTGFYVLRNTNMTAILIETLFISNDDDAILLIDESFQWAVARGILRGLYRYLDPGKKLYGYSLHVDNDYPSGWLLSNGSIAYAWHTNITGTYTIIFRLEDINGRVVSETMLTSTASYHPAVVESSDGKIFVFYNKPSGTYHNIYYRVYSPSSGWSGEYLLSSSATGYTSFPHAIRAGSRIIVFFHSNRDGDWDIYMKYSDDNGATWSDDIKIFDTTEDERAPRAFYGAGRIWLVYKGYRGTNYQVCVRYSEDLGVTWSPEIQLTSSSVDHNEPGIIGVYTPKGFRIIIFYVYDMGYTTNIYAFYSDDLGATWKWSPALIAPSLEYAPFPIPITNTSFRLLYSQMILKTSLSIGTKYLPADIYYLDIKYEYPKQGRLFMEWHYQKDNQIIVDNQAIVDYTMPVTYTLKYYGSDADLAGWHNRTFTSLLTNTTCIPLIQDLFTTQIPEYLSSSTSRELIARTILTYALAEGLSGVALDIETSLTADYETNMTDLLRRTYNYLSLFGILLINIVPPKESDTSWWYAYNYTELAQYSDYLVIMAYEYHGSWSGPGPISPTERVERIIDYAKLKVVDTEKLVMAFPIYGHDWYYDDNAGDWVYYRAVFYDDIVSIKQNYNYSEGWLYTYSEGSYSYEAQEYVLEYWGVYHHVVHFVDTESLLYRIGLSMYHNIEKISLWRVGSDTDPRTIRLIEKWKKYEISTQATTNTTDPVELFGATNITIEIIGELLYPSNITVYANTTEIAKVYARNGTTISINTADIQGYTTQLKIKIENQYETYWKNITIYRIDFNADIPETIVGTATITIDYYGPIQTFQLEISTDNNTWIELGQIEPTFLLNLTEYPNTTIYIRITATTQNNNIYTKTFGPINNTCYIHITTSTPTGPISSILELHEENTNITIRINTTATTNITIQANQTEISSFILLGETNYTLDTTLLPYGLTVLRITAKIQNTTIERVYLIYKLYLDLPDLPRQVLNYTVLKININASQYYKYFNVLYSYDNNTWYELTNTTNRTLTLNISKFEGDFYIRVVGVTRYSQYEEIYGPIRILRPITIVYSEELDSGLEIFGNDTILAFRVGVNISSSFYLYVNGSLYLEVELRENTTTNLELDTSILKPGYYRIYLVVRTSQGVTIYQRMYELWKLDFDLEIIEVGFDGVAFKISYTPGFRFFLVYALVGNESRLVTNTTGEFSMRVDELVDVDYIRIVGYTDRGEYSKLFINSVVVSNTSQQEPTGGTSSTEETLSHELDYGLVLPLVLVLAMVLVIIVVIRRLKKRSGSSI